MWPKIIVILFFSSEEWKKLKASDREKLGIVFENDGEFWSVHSSVNLQYVSRVESANLH